MQRVPSRGERAAWSELKHSTCRATIRRSKSGTAFQAISNALTAPAPISEFHFGVVEMGGFATRAA